MRLVPKKTIKAMLKEIDPNLGISGTAISEINNSVYDHIRTLLTHSSKLVMIKNNKFIKGKEIILTKETLRV